MVAPFIGEPLSECSTNLPLLIPSARKALRISNAAWSAVSFSWTSPSDNFAAVDVHDRIEAEEHPHDCRGQVGDVPTPHLVWGARVVAFGLAHGSWRLCFTAMVQLIDLAELAVEACLRSDIDPLCLPALGRSARAAGCRIGPGYRSAGSAGALACSACSPAPGVRLAGAHRPARPLRCSSADRSSG